MAPSTYKYYVILCFYILYSISVFLVPHRCVYVCYVLLVKVRNFAGEVSGAVY